MFYADLFRLLTELQDKDLDKYIRSELIKQRTVLRAIRDLAHQKRQLMGAEKQRRYRSKLRNEARKIKKEQQYERMKAAKKKITNPYFK